jgi:hypothetical protein
VKTGKIMINGIKPAQLIFPQKFRMSFAFPSLGASRIQFPHTTCFVSVTSSNEEEEATRIANLKCMKFDDNLHPSTLSDAEAHCWVAIFQVR